MNYIIISIIFLFCILYVIGEEKRSITNRKCVYFLFVIISSLVFSTRSLNSPDTAEYARVFEMANMNQGLFSKIQRFEAGYCALNRIVKIFTNNYSVLFFLISFVCYIFWDIFIKNESKYYRLEMKGKSEIDYLPLTFFLVYSSYYGLLYNGIVIRACVAISAVYLAASYFKSKKYIKGIILFVIAIMFHQTAILAIPIVLIYVFNIRIKKNSAFFIILLFLVLYVIGIGNYTTKFISQIVMFLYNKYPNVSLFWWASIAITGKNVVESGISLYRLFCFALLFILLIQNDEEEYADNYSFIAILGIVILTLFGNLEIMIRLAEYYLVALCLAFYKYTLTLGPSMNLIRIRKCRVVMPKLFLITLVSIAYYIVFLRNVVWV